MELAFPQQPLLLLVVQGVLACFGALGFLT